MKLWELLSPKVTKIASQCDKNSKAIEKPNGTKGNQNSSNQNQSNWKANWNQNSSNKLKLNMRFSMTHLMLQVWNNLMTTVNNENSSSGKNPQWQVNYIKHLRSTLDMRRKFDLEDKINRERRDETLQSSRHITQGPHENLKATWFNEIQKQMFWLAFSIKTLWSLYVIRGEQVNRVCNCIRSPHL